MEANGRPVLLVPPAKKEGKKLPFFQRVVKPSHSLSGLRVGAHEFQHSLRSDARPS